MYFFTAIFSNNDTSRIISMSGLCIYEDNAAYPHRIIILILSNIKLFHTTFSGKNEDNVSADSTKSGDF